MLNNFFQECFNNSTFPLSFLDLDLLPPCLEPPDELFYSVEEVEKLLESLDTAKSTGPDGISAAMLKYTAHHIAPSLTKIFNLSIKSGYFPIFWKMSNVVAIPKSDDRTTLSKYRPISPLRLLSKLLERHIYNLLYEHYSEFHPISENQWGFQPKKSTTTALLALTHEWHQLLKAKVEVCAKFFDFRKAFDSVPHRLLLDKLKQDKIYTSKFAQMVMQLPYWSYTKGFDRW